ncbi:MAG: hypothetical protein ABIG96_05220 [Candidatus Micrarchaeota archaeon]
MVQPREFDIGRRKSGQLKTAFISFYKRELMDNIEGLSDPSLREKLNFDMMPFNLMVRRIYGHGYELGRHRLTGRVLERRKFRQRRETDSGHRPQKYEDLLAEAHAKSYFSRLQDALMKNRKPKAAYAAASAILHDALFDGYRKGKLVSLSISGKHDSAGRRLVEK